LDHLVTEAQLVKDPKVNHSYLDIAHARVIFGTQHLLDPLTGDLLVGRLRSARRSWSIPASLSLGAGAGCADVPCGHASHTAPQVHRKPCEAAGRKQLVAIAADFKSTWLTHPSR
jgi:hypothetical protein